MMALLVRYGQIDLLPQAQSVFRIKLVCLGAILGFIWVLRLYVSPSTLAREITFATALAVAPALWIAWQRGEPAPGAIVFALICDLVALTLCIHFGGGADQTSGPILYGVVILLGGLLVSGRVVVLLTAVAIVLYCGMIAAEYMEWLPHRVAYRRPPDRQVATALMVSVYLVALGALLSYLVDLMRRLQKLAAETRGEALRTLSHDLKNALFAITGYAEMIAEEGDTASRERANRIEFLAGETEDLLANMIDATSTEARPLVARYEAVQPPQLLERIRLWFQGTANDIGVTLKIEGTDAPAVCLADSRLLQRALNNLVSNALRYVRPGGQIEVGCRQEGATILWWVEDTGDGIPSELLAQIFEPFVTSAGASGPRSHFGLGLFIVQKVAQAHGGEARVHSLLGQGSRFSISFPLRAPAPSGS